MDMGRKVQRGTYQSMDGDMIVEERVPLSMFDRKRKEVDLGWDEDQLPSHTSR
jgi:hypothetical protein